MDSHGEAGYPFTLPDLWRTTNLATIQDEEIAGPTDCWVLAKHGLDLRLDVEGENEDLFRIFADIDFSLPDLDKLEFRPLEDLELQESFSSGLTDDSADERETVSEIVQPIEEDIWLCPEVIAQVEPHQEFKSWEVFNDSGFREPRSEFISERGSIAFDAAVIAHEEAIGDSCQAKCGRILQSDPLLTVSLHNQVWVSIFVKGD